MVINVQPYECNEFRIALIHPTSGAVLTVEGPDGRRRLPRVKIPIYTRVTQRLHRAIDTEWKIRGVVLDYLQSEEAATSSPCAVLELVSEQTPDTLRAVDLCKMTDDLTERERTFILTLLRGECSNSLLRMGWIYEAVKWVEETTGERIHSIAELEQLNAGSGFALLRFPMRSGRSFWLKATGKPLEHEGSVTLCLSRLCPDYIPEVLALRPTWNAWIMPHRGPTCVQLPSEPKRRLRLLECAVTAIAEVQRQTVGREAELLAAGAFDQRVNVQRADSERLFAQIGAAMDRQTSTKVDRIERARLGELHSLFEATCDLLESFEIPATVLHGDLNPGNLLCGANDCQLIDWCEGYIGHPLITLQHLLLFNDTEDTQLKPAWDQHLIDRYLRVMSHVCDPYALDKALHCMPLIAAASAMYGRGTWLHSQLAEVPHRQAWIRTLARHMDRAARDPALLEMLSRHRSVYFG